jgi:hypothetical protein
VLCYPPQEYPTDRTRGDSDLPDTVRRKSDLFGIMRTFILPDTPDWKGTTFKVIHPCGRSCLKVVWHGLAWRDGRATVTRSKKTGEMIDRLGEPPFELK